ncbi:CaiB/BaiF CoA transferase family protein [Chloroflexota bacterium]
MKELQMPEGALSDLTILELGEMVSVPFCTKLMADMGAEVIKIETPLTGDSARQAGPFPDDIPHQEKSGLFLYLNANKLGITLDISKVEGQELLHHLIAKADVIVYSLQPEDAERLHLNYDYLKELNEGIVVCSITPFGLAGPYRSFKATYLTVNHISGAASTIGRPEREPITMPEGWEGYLTGVTAAGAILCALHARDMDGKGQDLDMAEADVMATVLMGARANMAYLAGEPTPRTGHRMPVMGTNVTMPCKDGYIALVANEDDQFQRLVEVMGNPEWGKEEIFSTRPSRAACADALEDLMLPWLMEHTKEEIFSSCQAGRVPTAPMYTPEEIANHPHLVERGFFPEIEHPVAGKWRYPGAPCLFSESPWALRRPAPTLGEHNSEVYCDRLGLSLKDFLGLRDQGII